jgi:hypothetical protein
MAAFLGLVAFIFGVLFVVATVLYLQEKRDLKAAQQENADIQEQAQNALARYQPIVDLEKHKAELESKLNSARAVLPRFQKLAELEQHKEYLTKRLHELQQAEAQWRQQIAAHQTALADLVAQKQCVEETLDMQSFGFYRPKYGFENSERYASKLASIRDAQEALVKAENATQCAQEWTVDGSAAKGRKMIKEHAKLMLRAFNGECDAATAKVKYNNVNNLENRINKSFEAINKLGESKKLSISQEFLNLKLQELYLVHEHREKVEEEKEEQRHIREQMREEEKALKEIEKAKKEAEKDEAIKLEALERARHELAEAEGRQTDRLRGIVDKLEAELKEALERKARAIARAQLTRSGHVYVLSNIGSFGENTYKIGMTRRLEPLERVDELSDASVPFRYDVHAMIYTEDAPALENLLHKYFESRRVNLVNLRREFFHVTLEEIQEAVEKHFGQITFVTVPEAEEYRKTLTMRESLANSNVTPRGHTPRELVSAE